MNGEHDTLKELFDSLPPLMQRAILSIDFARELEHIATTYDLSEEQYGYLETEVFLLVFGATTLADLEESIETQVELAHTEAVAIAGYIKEHIIPQVVVALEREEKKELAQAPVVPPPTPIQTSSVPVIPKPSSAVPTQTIEPMLTQVTPRAFNAIKALHTQFAPPVASPTRQASVPLPPKPPLPPVQTSRPVVQTPQTQSVRPPSVPKPIPSAIPTAPRTPVQPIGERAQASPATTTPPARLDPYREQI